MQGAHPADGAAVHARQGFAGVCVCVCVPCQRSRRAPVTSGRTHISISLSLSLSTPPGDCPRGPPDSDGLQVLLHGAGQPLRQQGDLVLRDQDRRHEGGRRHQDRVGTALREPTGALET